MTQRTSTTSALPNGLSNKAEQGAGTQPTGEGMSGIKEEAKNLASGIKDEAKHLASEAVQQARQMADAQLNSGKEQVAGSIGTVAQALRGTARELRHTNTGFGTYIDDAADRVEGISRYLENRDLTEVVGDVERFARREPLIFLGGSFAIGLMIGRFLKASAPPPPVERVRGYLPAAGTMGDRDDRGYGMQSSYGVQGRMQGSYQGSYQGQPSDLARSAPPRPGQRTTDPGPYGAGMTGSNGLAGSNGLSNGQSSMGSQSGMSGQSGMTGQSGMSGMTGQGSMGQGSMGSTGSQGSMGGMGSTGGQGSMTGGTTRGSTGGGASAGGGSDAMRGSTASAGTPTTTTTPATPAASTASNGLANGTSSNGLANGSAKSTSGTPGTADGSKNEPGGGTGKM